MRMITKELVDYIRKQSQSGSSKGKIAEDLLSNGWNTEDLDEGFSAAGVSFGAPVPSALTRELPSSSSASPAESAAAANAVLPGQDDEPKVLWPFPGQNPLRQTIGKISQESTAEKKRSLSLGVKWKIPAGVIGGIFFIGISAVTSRSGSVFSAGFGAVLLFVASFCVMILAKVIGCRDRTFLKALSISGFMGIFAGLILLNGFFGLPEFITAIIFSAGIIFTVLFSKKIYEITAWKAISLWLLYFTSTAAIGAIIFFSLNLNAAIVR